jgi:RHS repeat-associated protein
MEKDPEIKGEGNSYTTEFRQYDPRLGRWMSCDPKRHWFPDMSAYCFASNSPVAGKDDNGLYTIFVNGYIYGAPNWKFIKVGPVTSLMYHNDDLTPGKPYWTERGEHFINEAHKYFGDDSNNKFINGTGSSAGSTAQERYRNGVIEGKKMAEEIMKEIRALNSDDDPTNDVTEINMVSHSMGAAHSEGLLQEFMKNEDMAKLLLKGQVVHLSACDGDQIKIANNTCDLNRSQLNIMYDKTLWWADAGARKTAGYHIQDIAKYGVIAETIQTLHPKNNPKTYDPHYDTKSWAPIWNYMRALDNRYESGKNTDGFQRIRQSETDGYEDTIPNNKTNDKG